MVEIKIMNLTKEFSDEIVLNKINLNIEAGELVALLGPSGCGKTTTLKIISGLEAADAGEILFDGSSILSLPAEKRNAVLLFQEQLLFPHLNVEDNIAFGLKMCGVKKSKRKERVKELLEMVDLPGYQDYRADELSGGQSQRVALARALAIEPEVLLLDEPLSKLDANLREDMQKLIRELHLKEKMTTIFVTHDREEAMLVADKISIMNQGEVQQYGKSEELYKRPSNKFVADFFGKANYFNGKVENGKFICDYAEIPVNDNTRVSASKITTAMIRPEFIEFNRNSSSDKYLELEAEVKGRKFVGERIHYKLSLANEKIISATTLSQSSVEVSTKIKVRVALENIWFME